MARREYNVVSSGPQPMRYFSSVYARYNEQDLYDDTAGGSVSIDQIEVVYNSTYQTIAAHRTNSNHDFGFKYNLNQQLWTNQTIKWSTSTPNPGTNGVSPAYFNGGKLRLVFYGWETVNDATVFATCSNNGANYRGFLIKSPVSGSQNATFAEFATAASIPNSPTYTDTFPFTVGTPYNFQIDWSETQYCFKVYDSTHTTLIFNSGVRSTFRDSSCREIGLRTSKWDSNYAAPGQFYLNSYLLIDGSTVPNFSF